MTCARHTCGEKLLLLEDIYGLDYYWMLTTIPYSIETNPRWFSVWDEYTSIRLVLNIQTDLLIEYNISFKGASALFTLSIHIVICRYTYVYNLRNEFGEFYI